MYRGGGSTLIKCLSKLIGNLKVMIDILYIIIVLKHFDKLHHFPCGIKIKLFGIVGNSFQQCLIRLDPELIQFPVKVSEVFPGTSNCYGVFVSLKILGTCVNKFKLYVFRIKPFILYCKDTFAFEQGTQGTICTQLASKLVEY